MNKKCLSFVFAALLSAVNVLGADSDYNIECAGVTAKEGYSLVKVWVYSSNNKPDDSALKNAAVHGILFRGISPQDGCQALPPLAGSLQAYEQHADYFNAFFEKGGSYLSYASVVPASYEAVKLSKKRYKMGAKVMVSKDQLRRDLEKAGIIKGLSTGF